MRCRRENARYSTSWSAINKALTKSKPRLGAQPAVTEAGARGLWRENCGPSLWAARLREPETLQFFYDLGIPVANGYGLTEAGTAVTVNDLKPFRADTVGKATAGHGSAHRES